MSADRSWIAKAGQANYTNNAPLREEEIYLTRGVGTAGQARTGVPAFG